MTSTIRVATFNIRHGRPSGETATDNEQMGRTVAALGAEVVALQEVDARLERSGGVDQTVVAAEACGLSSYFGAVIGGPDGGEYGNALLFAGELLDVENLMLPSEGAEQRGAVVARVRIDDRDLTVAGTHLAHKRPDRPHNAAAQLDFLLAHLDDRAGPCVVMGDLNLEGDVVIPRLHDAGYSVVSTGPTFPAHSPRRRIDWIGHRDLALVAAVVPDVRSSDHRPIVAEFTDAGFTDPEFTNAAFPDDEVTDPET